MQQLTLGEHQERFSLHVIQLLTKADALGFGIRLGEVLRTPEQQRIYVNTGFSKTLQSQHLKKLAIDLNLFVDGRIATVDEIRPLGKFWEALDPLNRWGGSWRGLVESGASSFIDAPHYERLA